MAKTFEETLRDLDKALERNRKQDQIDREIASLSMKGMTCQLSGNIEGLKEIVGELEALKIRGATC